MKSRNTVSLALLGAGLGWAAMHAGGVTPDWNVSLALIALGGAVCWMFARPSALEPRERWLLAGVLLIPCYVAFQLAPLPLGLLRVLSPQRAAVTEALGHVLGSVTGVPLSVMPWATWTHLLRVLAYLVVFLSVREITRRGAWNQWAAAIPVLALAALEAGLGVLQYGAGTGTRIATGTFVDRNHYAFLLEVAAPFAFAWAVAEWQSLRKVNAGGLFALGGLLVCAIALSLSRTGIVAVLCAALVVGFGVLRGHPQARLIGGAAVLAIVLGAFALPSRLVNRMAEVAVTPGSATSDRTTLWRETVRIAQDYPLAGCGLGARPYTYFKYKTELGLWTTEYAHNDYLQLLAELGVLGMALLAWPAGMIAVHTLRAGAHSLPGLACVGALAAMAIHSFTEFNLYIPSDALLLAWVAGIGAGLPPRYNKGSNGGLWL